MSDEDGFGLNDARKAIPFFGMGTGLINAAGAMARGAQAPFLSNWGSLGGVGSGVENTARAAGGLGGGAVGTASKFFAPIALANGIYSMYDNLSRDDADASNYAAATAGGLQTFAGGVGTMGLLGGGATALSGTGLLAGTGAGAALGSAGGAMSGAAAALGPAAAVAGAGAAGYGLGTLANSAINSDYGRVFGTNEYGERRSSSDVAVDAAVSTDQWLDRVTGNDTIGDIGGGLVAGLGSIAMAPIGLAAAAGGAISDGVSAVFSW